MDFEDDVALMGHDGPGHIAIAHGKPRCVRSRSITARLGAGCRSRCRQTRSGHPPFRRPDGGRKAETALRGRPSVPGPILEIGNTNSRYGFNIGAQQFVNEWNAQGPAHHCAIGVGHVADRLAKLAALLQIECVRVC